MSPERFNSDLYLTTSRVAELLDVHPSTVKRWCNDEELVFATTAGGHRRIHLTDALDLARAKSIGNALDGFAPYEGHVWSAFNEVFEGASYGRVHSLAMGWLLRGRTELISRLFFELGRHAKVDLVQFFDEGVAGFMRDVGEAWCAGQLRVGEEHLLSETLFEVLVRLRDEILRRRGDGVPGVPRLVAVVGSMEGDRHSLGAFCTRLLLESEGWEVVYLGADVPVEDFASVQKDRSAALVGVSFAPPNTAADMRRCVRILSEFYDPDSPYALALGGAMGDDVDFSETDTPFDRLHAVSTLRAFREAILPAVVT